MIAGEQQSPEVHAMAHAINASLSNVGNTLYYTDPVEANPVSYVESLRELCADMDAGKVDTLVMIGVNPVYDAPHDFDFTNKLLKVRNTVQLSTHFDETAQHVKWHVGESHYLESWGDARAFDGTVSVIQPLIAPLYYTRSAHDVIAAFGDKPGVIGVRRFARPPEGVEPRRLRKILAQDANDGLVANSAFAPISVSAKVNIGSLAAPRAAAGEALEFIFRPDPSIYDGRYRQQRLAPGIAEAGDEADLGQRGDGQPQNVGKSGLTHKVAARGGEHGQIISPLIDIALSNSKVTAAAWTLPGQADGVDRSAARLRPDVRGLRRQRTKASTPTRCASRPRCGSRRGGKITKPARISVALHAVSLQAWKAARSWARARSRSTEKNPGLAHEGDENPPKDDSLYNGIRLPTDMPWGMAIDLNACIGCNACVVACQAENNIPVVGKDQVMRGREMHWIRIDRYYRRAGTNREDAIRDR